MKFKSISKERLNKHLGKPYRISKVDIYNLPNEDINDLGTLYLGGSISFVRRLKVEKTYTNQDTLYLVNYDVAPTEGFSKENRIKIAGPFHNMIIDTIWNVPIIGDRRFGDPIKWNERYMLNEWDGTPLPFSIVKVSSFCNNELGEAVIEIK